MSSTLRFDDGSIATVNYVTTAAPASRRRRSTRGGGKSARLDNFRRDGVVGPAAAHATRVGTR